MLSKWLKQYDDYIYFEEQKVAVGVVQRAWVPRILQHLAKLSLI